MKLLPHAPLFEPYSQSSPLGEHAPLVGSVAGHPLLTLPPSPPPLPPPPSP
jgi:hypothetical protein